MTHNSSTAERDGYTAPRPVAAAHRSAKHPVLSVVIPLLNESAAISRLMARLAPALDRIALPYEVLFIDDGSTDATLTILRELNVRDSRIKTVSLSRNFGKEVAVAAGLRYATGDAVILMDADLQHPPEVLPEFVSFWQQGYDDVYGRRVDRHADSALYRIMTRSFYTAFKVLSRTELHENAGDFRLLSRRAVDALNKLGERARFNKGLYAWVGFRSIGVDFDAPRREAGDTSRWPLRRLLRFAIDGIASFTTIPLRIWSYVGLLVSACAFAYAMIFLVGTLIYGAEVAGFPTLLISILMLSGVQLISLGIIGEYLGRIYEEVKARPLFLVAEEIGIGPSSGLEAGEASEKQPDGSVSG